MTEKLSKKYKKAIQENPNHVVLENGELNGSIAEFIEGMGESRISKRGVWEEEYIEIIKKEKHYEVHILKQVKEDGIIRKFYTEGRVGYGEAGYAITCMQEGESVKLHIFGKNPGDLVKKLKPYIHPVRNKNAEKIVFTILEHEHLTEQDLEERLFEITGNPIDGYVTEVEVRNKLGLHARSAGMIMKTASGYDDLCEGYIQYNGKTVNANSIIGVMTLGAPKGTKLKITTKGRGAKNLMHELTHLFESGFGESPTIYNSNYLLIHAYDD